MYAFMQSIQFVAGVFVLSQRRALLLNELVPAFRGIAMRIVPDAKPALDCPVLFPYAPNAVIVGSGDDRRLHHRHAGVPDVWPGDDPARSVNQLFLPAVRRASSVTRGRPPRAMIGGVIHGLFITFLPAILVPMLESYGFTGVTFSDSDVILGLVLGHAFQNNWLFVALFIVLLPHWHGS